MQPIPPPQGPPGAPPLGYPYPYPPPPKQSLLWLWIVLGVLGGVVIIGILAAIAIPSFINYQSYAKKAKRSEAELYLRKLERTTRQHYFENGALPRSVGPTPPLGTCCEGPGHKCAPDRALWSDAAWQALDFEIDEPSYFSYSFEVASDGQRYTARAHGDLDCDGTFIVYELGGTIRDGNLERGELIRPTGED